MSRNDSTGHAERDVSGRNCICSGFDPQPGAETEFSSNVSGNSPPTFSLSPQQIKIRSLLRRYRKQIARSSSSAGSASQRKYATGWISGEGSDSADVYVLGAPCIAWVAIMQKCRGHWP